MRLRLALWTIWMLKAPYIGSYLAQFMPLRFQIWRYNRLRGSLLKRANPEIVAVIHKYFPPM